MKSLIATLNIYPGTAWMSYFELNGFFLYVQYFLLLLDSCKAFKKNSSDYIINDVVFIDDI